MGGGSVVTGLDIGSYDAARQKGETNFNFKKLIVEASQSNYLDSASSIAE